MGTKYVPPQLETLRTIHGFDPRIACAERVIDLEGREVAGINPSPWRGIDTLQRPAVA